MPWMSFQWIRKAPVTFKSIVLVGSLHNAEAGIEFMILVPWFFCEQIRQHSHTHTDDWLNKALCQTHFHTRQRVEEMIKWAIRERKKSVCEKKNSEAGERNQSTNTCNTKNDELMLFRDRICWTWTNLLFFFCFHVICFDGVASLLDACWCIWRVNERILTVKRCTMHSTKTLAHSKISLPNLFVIQIAIVRLHVKW